MSNITKRKVLIVDDHPSIRFLVASLVETAEFTVCGQAADGLEAIEKAKEVKPDLILLDFSMPRMNGAEAAVILKKLMPSVPIILFTLHQDSVNSALAAAMQVDKVIAKTDGMTTLLGCMRDLLGLASPKQAEAVGPLKLTVEPLPEMNHSTHPSPTEEKPPE